MLPSHGSVFFSGHIIINMIQNRLLKKTSHGVILVYFLEKSKIDVAVEKSTGSNCTAPDAFLLAFSPDVAPSKGCGTGG